VISLAYICQVVGVKSLVCTVYSASIVIWCVVSGVRFMSCDILLLHLNTLFIFVCLKRFVIFLISGDV
jgi:hypothetical protein